ARECDHVAALAGSVDLAVVDGRSRRAHRVHTADSAAGRAEAEIAERELLDVRAVLSWVQRSWGTSVSAGTFAGGAALPRVVSGAQGDAFVGSAGLRMALVQVLPRDAVLMHERTGRLKRFFFTDGAVTSAGTDVVRPGDDDAQVRPCGTARVGN